MYIRIFLIKAEFKQPSAILISCCVCLAITLFGVYWTQSSNNAIIDEQKRLLTDISRTQASALEKRLSSAFTSTQFLAAEIEQHNGVFNDFDRYSYNLMHSIEGISSLQLAPNGVIDRIYPLAGNEAAIGLDIFSNPKYQEAAELAIKEHKMIAIGPLPLVQGGLAVISRSPAYLYKGSQREVFWGFASAIINLNELLASTRLKDLESGGYQYTLSRLDSNTKKNSIFAQSKLSLDSMFAMTKVKLPVGVWELKVSRNINDRLSKNLRSGYLLTAIASLLFTLAIYRLLIQPLRLRTIVKEKTAELKSMAYKDSLTNLPNRHYLNDYFPALVDKGLKNQEIAAFIYFDLDNFKRINDTIGHDIGDKVLASVAQRLQQLCRGDDTVVRLGGDEFSILFNNIQHEDNAKKSAERVLKAIHTPLFIDSREFILSTSLGIAMIPDHGDNLVTIMQNADLALYQAKQQGKNQYCLYHHDMKIHALHLAEIEKSLSTALQNNEFELYYQPQFNLKTKVTFGAEALIRWNHPTKGRLSPDQFIHLAENTGQIIEIDHWVLEEGIAYLARRYEQGLPYILLHVNLSSLQLSDPNFVSLVKDLLNQYQVPAQWLGIEVTETTLLEDVHLASVLLKALQDMGICIAIDDFGTGYSSLGQLKNLPVNLLKIDRCFITDLERDEADRKIVEAIIAMAHKLDIKVLAEGIENQHQWDILEGFLCDFGQGYYVSDPIIENTFNSQYCII